ncbi:serine/threonine-protein kinase [Bailinhaonella thermotolerans]|uniref:serine/threonine-protein kinase n=1 Tax=Bailinhaonella thermotolerans TaxID=1070861 RepID=UPI00192A380A|nr:serine/threonine-protein kinase [Bailinhaonella thermotolerans]
MQRLRPGDPAAVSGYKLIGRLGAGGMGQVFLGRSPGGLPVAIKVVHPHLAEDPEFLARFRREVAAARAVSGPYTAPVVDADPDADPPWLATAFLPGLSLHDTVAAHGPLPERTVRTLGAGLAEALVSIHRAGVVHRDLKPSNVILTPQGPRVIDFGIARAADATAATQSGMVVGSPGYITPEQVTAGTASPAGDVFSLGAVLVYAATGATPFGEGPAHVVVYRVVHEPPRLDGVPGPLRDLVAACLAKDPDRRPTPAQVLDRLAEPTGEPGPGWLPDPVAEHVTARVRLLPPTRVLPEPGESPGAGPATHGTPGAVGTPVQGPAGAPPGPQPPAPPVEEGPDEPRTPPRRVLGAVLAVAAAATVLTTGLTHPAVWPDGRVCADLAAGLERLPAPAPVPPRTPTFQEYQADPQAFERRRRDAELETARREDRHGRDMASMLTGLSRRASGPTLKRALEALAAVELRAEPKDFMSAEAQAHRAEERKAAADVRRACG